MEYQADKRADQNQQHDRGYARTIHNRHRITKFRKIEYVETTEVEPDLLLLTARNQPTVS